MGSIKTMNVLLVVLSVLIVGQAGYSAYKVAKAEKKKAQLDYTLEHEPDPLTVERVVGDDKISICKDRNYEFRRLVKATKNLDIYVQWRWHSLDGKLDVNGIDGEIVLSQPIHYPFDAGFEKSDDL